MDFAVIHTWLARKNRAAILWRGASGILFLVAGLLVLFVSFWVTYGVLWFLSFSFFRVGRHVLLLISGAFMALVVSVGSRQNLEDLDLLKAQQHSAEDLDITLASNRYGMRFDTNVAAAGAFEVRSIASLCNYVLCGGVKLVLGAIARLRLAHRLRSLDIEACARVVELLWTMNKRQSFAEIVQRVPGLNPVRVFEDLRSVEGILFLASEPAGLALHPDLRGELDSLAAR
jgi:hypothetical protein